jgi:Cupin
LPLGHDPQCSDLQDHLTRARASGGVFAGSVARPSWGLRLPGTIQLAPHTAARDPLHGVIGPLSRELSGPAPVQQTVLDRLLDVLLVLAMRASFEQSPAAPRRYQASSDPRLSPALHAIHAEAGRPWTVPQRASLSRLSRLFNSEQQLGDVHNLVLSLMRHEQDSQADAAKKIEHLVTVGTKELRQLIKPLLAAPPSKTSTR